MPKTSRQFLVTGDLNGCEYIVLYTGNYYDSGDWSTFRRLRDVIAYLSVSSSNRRRYVMNLKTRQILVVLPQGLLNAQIKRNWGWGRVLCQAIFNDLGEVWTNLDELLLEELFSHGAWYRNSDWEQRWSRILKKRGENKCSSETTSTDEGS